MRRAKKCDEKFSLFQVMNEFDVIDVISNTNVLPYISVVPRTVRSVYLFKREYDVDVSVGQHSFIAAYRQLQLDIPRCTFSMDGKRTIEVPPSLPSKLVRYCTQAVLGLPVQMLTTDGVVVCECADRQEMRVEASKQAVSVTKTLNVWHVYSDCKFRVCVCVHVSTRDPVVEVLFYF